MFKPSGEIRAVLRVLIRAVLHLGLSARKGLCSAFMMDDCSRVFLSVVQ